MGDFGGETTGRPRRLINPIGVESENVSPEVVPEKEKAVGTDNASPSSSSSSSSSTAPPSRAASPFTAQEMDDLMELRHSLAVRAPGTYKQLSQYYSTNHDRCVTMIGTLLKSQYGQMLPLFDAHREDVVTALFVET